MPDANGKHPQGPSLRSLLACQGAAVIASAAATFAVIVGFYAAACVSGAPSGNCILAALAAGTIWTAVASPIMSAGAAGALASAMRLAAVVDTAGVSLLVIWLCGRVGIGGGVGFVAAVKIYCVWAVMALAGFAAVFLARSAAGRYAIGVAAGLVGLLAAASPFWTNGIVEHVDAQTRQAVVTAAVQCNPFYAVMASVVDQTRLVWHQAPVLYDITRIGQYNAPAPAMWHPFVIRCGALALFLAACAVIRRRLIEKRD